MRICFAVCCVILLPCAEARCVEGARSRVPKEFTWSEHTEGPVCGVYAVCRAMHLCGVEVSPSALWKRKYVTGEQGSTPRDLVEACADCGCDARTMYDMSVLDIRLSKCPMVLNVRSSPLAGSYDHWVCVTAHGDEMLVYDGSGSGKPVSSSEFSARWSGVGIVVSHGKLGWFALHGARVLGQCYLCGIVALLVVVSGKLLKGKALASILFASLVSAVLGGAIYGVSDWPSTEYSRMSLSGRLPGPKPGDLADLVRARADEKSLLIDARTEDSFRHGSITGAVNIPVYATYDEIKEFLGGVTPETNIVVFCQSRSCNYDEQIAEKLCSLGYQNVTVSDVGYAEFVKSERAE